MTTATETDSRTMKAVTLAKVNAAPTLVADLPVPVPAADELLIRVRASSVNPVDNAVAAGVFNDVAEHRFPITLGRD